MSGTGNANGSPLRSVPANVWVICATVAFMTLIACFTFLAYTESDATELRALINTVFNAVSVIFSGGAFVYGAAAARASRNADTQTNGGLETRIRDVVRSEMRGNDGR